MKILEKNLVFDSSSTNVCAHLQHHEEEALYVRLFLEIASAIPGVCIR